MDAKQVEKLIKAAQYCKTDGMCFNCKHDTKPECMSNIEMSNVGIATLILEISGIYEAKLKALEAEMLIKAIRNAECARKAAIQEVRGLISEKSFDYDIEGTVQNLVFEDDLLGKLDSMEPDKGDQ